MNKQIICTGDVVLLTSYLCTVRGSRRHCNKLAIVEDVSGERVSLLHEDGSATAWWPMEALIACDSDRPDLIAAWKKEREEFDRITSDLDWIFGIKREITWHPPTASVQRLFTELGGGDIWGKRGEGVVLMLNATKTLRVARPFLLRGDRDGFIKYAQQVRERNTNAKD